MFGEKLEPEFVVLFIKLLTSDVVNQSDNRLKKESDIEKIKLVLGLN